MVPRAVLILLCLSLTAAAQTKPKSSAQSPAPKTAPKSAPAKTSPTAIIHTTAGDMKCTLLPDKDPKAVANFIGLAKGTKAWKDPNTGKEVHGKPLYDGVTFHRTIPEFMIQAGDPTGTGSGDVGFEISDELHADLLFDQPGRMAMANRGGMPATSSSQFFITEKELPILNPCLDPSGCPQLGRALGTGYIIFGQCDESAVELVKKIARMPCANGAGCDGRNDRPQNPVKIQHIEIQSAGGTSAAKPPAKKPSDTKAATPPKSTAPKN
jgi:peptidyl-prolyl cis-trans isomerase A (cyclophilin A)